MKILVLGGTQFLGRHFVRIAKEKGHEVTLFNRGKTNPDLFKDIQTIIGDRTKDIKKLKNLRFDAVVDTSGYYPDNVNDTTKELKDIADYYLFVSTCSVYNISIQTNNGIAENGQLVDLNIDITDSRSETYGAKKYLCEEIVRKEFPHNHFIVRPGLIVGPYDSTYRFPYWADRVSEGGEVLAPGDPNAPVQFIDARDLSEWMLMGIENKIYGTFNTTSPYKTLTLGSFLDLVKNEINPQAVFRWVPEIFLKEENIACWTTLPLWLHTEIQSLFKIDSSKAMARGLKFRPISETINDTYQWSFPIYQKKYLAKVLSRERELELLKQYAEK